MISISLGYIPQAMHNTVAMPTADHHTPEELLGPLNDVERKHAPKELYVRGDTGILQRGARVSIVGSRNASREGLIRSAKLARLLAERGMVVVSGLAEGIDTAAHVASMNAGGRTIAVLGTPLDQCYPKTNAALQEQIARDHLVISQFAPGTRVFKSHFPARNRTMALISHATVIIEATNESGSLHQAWEALRLGRPLYFAKSNLDVPGLTWPQKLQEYGAQILADDTLNALVSYLPDDHDQVGNAAIPF